ncbi:preprotein translocase subunit SecD [Corynebacterium gerontici]|uniref:Protein translocase subunit SecD n=2 Tax=Corynebacterium gerontici TaxID=2079234 RepID=A0A3G6J6A8_9CORY|nr:preprotein translocase subunit SecD [Corynebacterium gerontici]
MFIAIVALIYALVFFTGDGSAQPNLGIDLQGGTRVTLVPQGQDPSDEQLAQARNILEQRVNGMGVTGATVVADGKTLVITVPGDDTARARALGQTSQLLFRPVAQPQPPNMDTLNEDIVAMANRWVEVGVLSPDQANEAIKKTLEGIAQADGKKPEDVTVPKVSAQEPKEPKNSIESEELRNKVIEVLKKDRQSTDPNAQLAASALLQCNDEPDPLQGTDDPAKPLVACASNKTGEQSQKYILDPSPLLIGEEAPDGKRLTGNEIDTSKPITGGLNPQTGEMEINFAFKADNGDEGSATWSQLTTDYLNKQIAITLDSKIISAPVIQSPTPVGSTTSITGSFTQEQAQELANNLKYGALPLSFAGENGESGGTTTTVPASLGAASLKAGLIAGLVGLMLVALYSIVNYRVFGVVSMVALAGSFALVYGALVLLGRWIGYSLDLAGIAGLIIGIGTTADSFVVLYERIKDEVREGRTFRSAVPRGWDRAKQTIVTGNAVTLIGAVVIYFLAVGSVKGFAFTLGLTTLFDLVVVFLFTAPLVILTSRKAWASRPSANGLGKMFKVGQSNRIQAERAEAEENQVEQMPSAPSINNSGVDPVDPARGDQR